MGEEAERQRLRETESEGLDLKERAQILAENPIADVIEAYGIVLRGSGKVKTGNRCALTEHKAGHQCVTVDTEKAVWHCADCQKGGSIIDFVSMYEGIEVAAAMKKLAREDGNGLVQAVRRNYEAAASRPAPATTPAGPPVKPEIVAKYNYRDDKGKLLYQVCRMQPKSFRQRRPEGDKWVWNMEGVTRVLYNLATVKAADFVWIVEGEKDADTLNAISAAFNATCNVGGAGKWEDSYSRTLKGKEVILCGDNDDAGRKHVELVKKALADYAKSLRIVELPPEYKDASEYAASFDTPADAGNALYDLAEKAEVLHGGVRVPVFSMAEMETGYVTFIKQQHKVSLHLDAMFPRLALAAKLRPVVPGELVTFLASTGVGKTMLLQNLARTTRLTTLLFEFELPSTLTFERFVGIEMMMHGAAVAASYKEDRAPDWRKKGGLNHIHVCSESKLTVPQLEEIIVKAGIKIGHRPHLVLVDYVQLIQATGGSRYERTSSVAEDLKILAKSTNTIVVIASQVGRGEGGSTEEVTLFSGKDSGSIENSSGLVIGAWRCPDPEKSRSRMWVKVLKNTKGISGEKTAMCIGADLQLNEEAFPDAPMI